MKKSLKLTTFILLGILSLSLFTNGCNLFGSVPSTFDPTATKGVIGANNSVQMTPEEYANVGPQIVENGHINIPFPIKFKDGIIRTIHYEISADPINKDKKYNIMLTIDGLEEGDILVSPIDGEIPGKTGQLSNWYKNTDGSFSLWTSNIVGKDSSGHEIDIWFSYSHAKPVINRETLSEYEKDSPIQVKIGDPIYVFTSSEKDTHYNGQVQFSAMALGLPPVAIATTVEGKAIAIK
jgi:hypothetical protein